MCPIAWDEGSPSSSGQRVRIYNNHHDHAYVRPLCEVFRVFTHWGQTGTVPCLGAECPHCRNGSLSRRIGYAAADVKPRGGEHWTECIWHVPERNLPDLLDPDGLESHTVGFLFEVSRNSKAASKPLTIKRLSQPPVTVQTRTDVKKILEAIWQPYVISVLRANVPAPEVITEGGEILPYSPPSRNGTHRSLRMKGGA